MNANKEDVIVEIVFIKSEKNDSDILKENLGELHGKSTNKIKG